MGKLLRRNKTLLQALEVNYQNFEEASRKAYLLLEQSEQEKMQVTFHQVCLSLLSELQQIEIYSPAWTNLHFIQNQMKL